MSHTLQPTVTGHRSGYPTAAEHQTYEYTGTHYDSYVPHTSAPHTYASSYHQKEASHPHEQTIRSALNPLADEWKSARTQDDIPNAYRGNDLQSGSMHPVPQKSAPPQDKPVAHELQQEDQSSHKDQIRSPVNKDDSEFKFEMHRQLLDAINLPRSTMMVFDGDPMNYWTFTNAFDSCVDSCSVSDGVKLNRLFEYCTGKAAKVIKPCALMHPTEGYHRARILLHERFGNDFKIAEAWIRKVTEGSVIRPNNGADLQDLADDVRSCAETFGAMGRLEEIDSRVRMVKIVQRLPVYLQSRWRKEAVNMKDRLGQYPNIRCLVEFLDKVANEMNDPVFGAVGRHQEPKSTRRQEKSFKSFAVQASEASDPKKLSDANRHKAAPANRECPICKENHNVTNCKQFKQMPPEKRLELAKEKKLCFSCLKAGKHTIRWCKFRRTCGIDGCTHKHSRLLHTNDPDDSRIIEVHETTPNDKTVEAKSYACGPVLPDATKIALPIVAVRVRGKDQDSYINTLALLDPGSNRTFCSQTLVEQLGVEGTKTSLSLSTLNDGQDTEAVIVSLEVTGKSKRKKNNYIQLPRVFALNKFPALMSSVANAVEVAKWDHLKDIDITPMDKSGVTMVIGQDVPQAIMPLEIRRGRDQEPYAVRTKLGWVLNGPIDECHNDQQALCNFIQAAEHTDVTLENQVEQFWKLDTASVLAGSTPEMSVDDKKVIEIWNSSLMMDNGHYSMNIPFKEDPPEMPDNKSMAQKRLQSLGRRLSRDPELHQRYKAGIDDLIQKGYAEQVPEDEVESSSGWTWYLPHHNVINPNKPDKLRIVFDCAAEYAGTSLNKQVLQGPDLTNKMIGVLMRFREDPVAIMGDVEAMFHQVKVSHKHRNALRFLWWKDGDIAQEPQVFRMTVHLFGGVWSPSCASFALRRTAEDHMLDFDEVTVRTILENFYVDDCLKSQASDSVAIRLVSQLCQLLSRGGFRLTKRISNSHSVMASIPEDDRAKGVRGLDLNLESLPIEKSLGVQWDTNTDTLGIKIKSVEKPTTRRGLLSMMSSVYDPLGFVCPFVLQAKKIFQAECKSGKGWDTELDTGNMKLWLKWVEDLPVLEQFQIPRCLYPEGYGPPVQAQLHHFCDASQAAYGAVSYVRLTNSKDEIHCSLLFGKSRLAPIKTMTIPRLELSAAVVAVRMDSMLRQELKMTLTDSVFWTDSTTVLQYIKNTTKRFHTFVANRIAVIHDGSQPTQWRYVEGQSNPADDASRGLDAQQMVSDERWKQGPSFLWKDESEWPSLPEISLESLNQDKEVKKDVQACTAKVEESDDQFDKLLQSYSCWFRLRKAVAWLHRFKDWLKAGKDSTATGVHLQVKDLQAAETTIVKYLQKKYFKQDLSQNSTISSLEPFRDSDGIIRMGGRLLNAPIMEHTKHPIILPRDHHVSTLIVRHAHECQSGHAGREYVVSVVRQRFWIPRIRPLVNKVLRSCIICKRLRGVLGAQRMADLPKERVTPHKPPFTDIGIDCFGPFYVKRGRGQEKRYGCLFTCLALRAIHIEKLSSLDTDAFLNALIRFTSRRGVPETIRTDNGTNFVGAKREITQAVESWNKSQKLHKHLLVHSTRWYFNPPAASHQGGVWERQIRSVRSVLNAVLRNQVLDDERLETVFCEAEAIVNGRPLTPVSDSPSDSEPLTPNHLLLLRGSAPIIPGHFTKDDKYSRRWRHVQYLADVFWKRWIREYLPTLQLRDKWIEIKRNLKENDIVLILDEATPRLAWPLGRVLKTLPGRDGLVRSAVVKTRGTVLTRPVNKLCLLEAVSA